MVTVSVVLNLGALYVVVATLATLTLYIVFQAIRNRRNRRSLGAVNQAITNFFKNYGVEVVVTCYAVLGGRRFVALIESKPSEKLRCSHVIEISVIEHVRREIGQQIERVFWRFPIPVLDKEEFVEDLYLSQGIQSLKNEGYRVDEMS